MPVNLKILSKEQIITSFLLVNIGKKALCVYCCALLFQQLITSWKCIFALEVQSSFLHCIEIDISCSRKCKKIHAQFLMIFRSWKNSTWRLWKMSFFIKIQDSKILRTTAVKLQLKWDEEWDLLVSHLHHQPT